MPPDVYVSNPQLWTCTGILLVLDVLLVSLARRNINREQFRRMRWLLAVAGGAFFLLVWSAAMLWAWDWFYSYIFPNWARILLPAIFGLGYTLLALGMFWLSLKIQREPAFTWCVLGGVEGFLSHLYAIYGLGAASKPPIMQDASQLVVLIFAFFEVAFYWSIILLACKFLSAKLFHKSRKDELTPC